MSDLSYDEFREIAAYAVSRLDGAWFRTVAQKYGIPEAVDLDVKAWEDFAERLARKMKNTLELEGEGIEFVRDAFPRISNVWTKLLGAEGEIVFTENEVISRVTRCQYWENIKNAGFNKFAEAGLMCSRVHVASYTGFLRGAFPDMKCEVAHTKRIPNGDSYCEVHIKLHLDSKT